MHRYRKIGVLLLVGGALGVTAAYWLLTQYGSRGDFVLFSLLLLYILGGGAIWCGIVFTFYPTKQKPPR